MRLGREQDALEAVRKYIAPLGEVRLSCPNLVELVQQTKRYDVLAEVAREQGHAVNFVAGLIAARPIEPRAEVAPPAKPPRRRNVPRTKPRTKPNHQSKVARSKRSTKPARKRKVARTKHHSK